ncbi:hypothetical protein COJ69_23720 [Bacillus cereus]|nr:hypothetical protein CN393_06650 [Bacillus cereus]PFN19205.1 hypothetical protein COJ69_23720 [Bacillus cereus]
MNNSYLFLISKKYFQRIIFYFTFIFSTYFLTSLCLLLNGLKEKSLIICYTRIYETFRKLIVYNFK